MELPHIAEIDALGALQIARLEALIESCEAAISSKGVMRAQAAADIMLRAIRRQAELLDRYGLTPRGRADWVSKLTRTSLGDDIRQRLARLEAAER